MLFGIGGNVVPQNYKFQLAVYSVDRGNDVSGRRDFTRMMRYNYRLILGFVPTCVFLVLYVLAANPQGSILGSLSYADHKLTLATSKIPEPGNGTDLGFRS